METESQPISGKIIAITGASRGLGAGFARRLAREGARLVLLARPSRDFDELAASLPDALQVGCDVGTPDDVRQAFAKIRDRFGKLNVLINNAALNHPSSIEHETDDRIQSVVATNLMGPIFTTRAALPLLRAAGGGDIVNISSVGVKRTFPLHATYTATKAGLEALSAHYREELRGENIRVVVLRSGNLSESSIGANWDAESAREMIEAMRRSGSLAYVGGGVSSATMAQTPVHLLSLPREAAIDLVELRGI
jgi:NAD(P)-dependent dehydrogenase (short-subunit alcohol dehydrogenase family)